MLPILAVVQILQPIRLREEMMMDEKNECNSEYVYILTGHIMGIAVVFDPQENPLWIGVPKSLLVAYLLKEWGGHLVRYYKGGLLDSIKFEHDPLTESRQIPQDVKWQDFLPPAFTSQDEWAFAAAHQMAVKADVDHELGEGAYESIQDWQYWPNPDHPKK